MTIGEAVRIGMYNPEAVRVLPTGASGVPVGRFEPAGPKGGPTGTIGEASRTISLVSPDADLPRFTSEVMAHVRSIEQQYWNLSQQYVQLWAVEKAVGISQAVLDREEARRKTGEGNAADVAEASQRLEQLRLDLVSRTSDVITAERQLRHLLGLPPADNRRIIPVSAPVEVKLEPDWDASRVAMLEKQPDIVRAKAFANRPVGPDPAAARVARAVLPDLADQAPPALPAVPESSSLQQVIHQATHSLARFFLELDANYKQYQTAKKLRAAASDRMELQRDYYEQGRITLDRYLDAVSQYAAAVAQEAQHKTSYNISIVALEEAKGTLLEREKIAVVRPARFESAPPTGKGSPPESRDSRADPANSTSGAAGSSISFHLTINLGPRPFEVRGSLTVGPAVTAEGAKKP
jgi:hypothetical protein